MHDYHVHTNYSDGDFLPRMVSAAEEAGLDGVGFADHCNVFGSDGARAYRNAYGFNLDITYDRRRQAIEQWRERTALQVYDAVEMDYHPDFEDEIADFLAEADFEYAIGSVHAVDGANVHNQEYFGSLSANERADAIETYVDRATALIDSELFDIAAHLDLVERNPALRGLLTEDHYQRLADALANSQTVPEINAGRVLDDYGRFHPRETFIETLLDAGVAFTIGSDAHDPEELIGSVDRLRDVVDDQDLPVVNELPTVDADT